MRQIEKRTLDRKFKNKRMFTVLNYYTSYVSHTRARTHTHTELRTVHAHTNWSLTASFRKYFNTSTGI